MSRTRHAGWLQFASLLVLGAVIITSFRACQPRKPIAEIGPREFARMRGGQVHGTVWVEARLIDKDVSGDVVTRPIVLPDFEVYLHNIGTGADSIAVTTDLHGRYYFPHQPAGQYRLRWNAQRGWSAGAHPDKLVIKNFSIYPVPATPVVDKRAGVVYGRVKFEDGSSPWFRSELFKVDLTATVRAFNPVTGDEIAKAVRANSDGYYALAGLSRLNLELRSHSEAASVSRSVSAGAISFGGAIASVDLVLPNHRPEILAIHAESAGDLIHTANPGDSITLAATWRDLDSDRLIYEWRLQPGNGSIVPIGSGDRATWKLPEFTGQHAVYLIVRDRKGGYSTTSFRFNIGKTTATFSGRAVDSNGLPVEKATVTVNGSSPVTTNARGFFFVQVPLTDRYVLNISKTGYALLSRILRTDAMGKTWKLVSAQTGTVDPRGEITLTDDRPELRQKKMRGASITVPPGALVDSDGNPPTGTLTGSIATIDIANGEAPGDWGALNDRGEDVSLLSYGVTFVEFTDSSGKKYGLRAGAEAQVMMPVLAPSPASAPPNVPLWYYDEVNGYWMNGGKATLDAATGRFVGAINHLSYVNTDIEKVTPACLKIILYPPIPNGLTLRVTDGDPAQGVNFTQSYEGELDTAINAVYRLPPDTDIRLELLNPDGTAYPDIKFQEVPGTDLPDNVVNSGPALSELFPPEPYDICKLVIVVEGGDNSGSGAKFFTFRPPAEDGEPEAYYKAVDPPDAAAGFPDGRRTTLGDWWTINGFDLDGNATDAVRTAYLNYNDLGSGREMVFLDHGDGRISAYVTNYGDFDQNHGNADLAAGQIDPGATVCMEYAPVSDDPDTTDPKIVKFFVFAGNGNGADAARQIEANLDELGAKGVPNLCLMCHGGDLPSYTTVSGELVLGNPDLGATFRELDLATYKFSEGRETPDELDSTEKQAFKDQNLQVRNSDTSGISVAAIKDLYDGWYESGGLDQDNAGWEPDGWDIDSDTRTLYHDLVARNCRTCHIAFPSDDEDFGNNWATYAQFNLRHDNFESFVLLRQIGPMPNGATTYRNFWLLTDVYAPDVLRHFSRSDWDEIEP